MMPSVCAINSLQTTGDFNTYINSVYAIPLLSEEQEQELFTRLQRCNDLDAARTIITAHLRFVVHIAKSYRGYGLPLEDLIQEGNIGLMKSVKRFDLSYGVRLASFAVHWIKAEIHEYVLRNWRLVKIATTKAQRKLFFRLRSMKNKLTWLSRDEAELIARDLNVTAEDVLEMESRLRQQDCFFDESFGEADDIHDTALAAKSVYLEDHTQRPDICIEEAELRSISTAALYSALQELDPRSRDIIESRWLGDNKAGLKELAQRYDISMERVRQIEAAAMRKINKQLPPALTS